MKRWVKARIGEGKEDKREERDERGRENNIKARKGRNVERKEG